MADSVALVMFCSFSVIVLQVRASDSMAVVGTGCYISAVPSTCWLSETLPPHGILGGFLVTAEASSSSTSTRTDTIIVNLLKGTLKRSYLTPLLVPLYVLSSMLSRQGTRVPFNTGMSGVMFFASMLVRLQRVFVSHVIY